MIIEEIKNMVWAEFLPAWVSSHYLMRLSNKLAGSFSCISRRRSNE